MLAARDQENLVHGHQTIAASKAFTQGAKQLPPKTPGNKIPKTPFKVPLNDKNGTVLLGVAGKSGFGAQGLGNENFVKGAKKAGLGDKDAYVTPLGPRNRAPLGLKTTNAKAKAFQTPAPVHVDNETKKEEPKNASIRKAKPRVSHADMTKLGVLADKDELDDEDDIEYMPPKPKDMPDYQDDMPHEINLSMFKDGPLQPGFLHHFISRVGDDGLTFYQRKEREQQKMYEITNKMNEATILRDFEGTPFPCVHLHECPGEECTASIENRKSAEERYQATIKALSTSPKNSKTAPEKQNQAKGPSTLTSKSAATALSQPRQPTHLLKAKPSATSSAAPPAKPTVGLPRSKKHSQATNPSPMRHTAASALSKTTIGHSKGRATSAALRRTALTPTDTTNKPAETPDPTLAPATYIARYGVPRVGSEQWIRCKNAGCFDEVDEVGEMMERTKPLMELLTEDADVDFQF